MVSNPYPYPGGKAYLADWIVDHIPRHNCYVEPFAGSAAVLFRKDVSNAEIINDQDGDVTQFFLTLRDRTEELIRWVRNSPYSRDLHRKYARQFYAGYRPDEPIDRAGRFFYLRYSQYAGKYRTKSGFGSAATNDKATQMHNAAEKLEWFADRLRQVQIENRDYETMFSRFDRPDTVFYCDPPYVDAGDALYSHGEFDHGRFVDVLEETSGRWLISYEKIPERLQADGYTVVSRDRRQYMSEGHDDADQYGEENLIMNFDPTQVAQHQSPDQQTLGEIA